MHSFAIRERVCLLIIQSVTVHGFYRLPLQVKEHLIPFKLSMSAGELYSAELIVKLPQQVLGVFCGFWILQTKCTSFSYCMELSNVCNWKIKK